MKKPVFKGVGVAMSTPFTADGKSVNYDVIDELVDFHLKNSTDALIVCGTGGEASTLTDEEQISVIKAVVEKVDGKIPVIGGAGSNDTRHGIELAKKVEAVGADALLVVTPYYNKTTQKGLIAHFTAIADSVKIPIIMYNVPGRTGMTMTADTVATLAKHPNINAIKEASGNVILASEIAQKCGDDLFIYSGDDALVLPILALGGMGVISTIGNIKPKDVHDLCYRFFEGDIEGSRAIQFKQLDLIATLFSEVSPVPTKKAVNLMGINVGPCRMPLCEISDECLERLKKSLANY